MRGTSEIVSRFLEICKKKNTANHTAESTVLQLADGHKLDVSSGFTSNAYLNLTRNSPPDYQDFDSETGQWAKKAASFKLWSNATHLYFYGRYRINTPSQNVSDVYSASCINSTTSVLFLNADHYSYFGGAGPLQLYDDPSCEVWYPLAPVIRDAYGVWNKSYLRSDDNYECVSRDVYTWVRILYHSFGLHLFWKERATENQGLTCRCRDSHTSYCSYIHASAEHGHLVRGRCMFTPLSTASSSKKEEVLVLGEQSWM